MQVAMLGTGKNVGRLLTKDLNPLKPTRQNQVDAQSPTEWLHYQQQIHNNYNNHQLRRSFKEPDIIEWAAKEYTASQKLGDIRYEE